MSTKIQICINIGKAAHDSNLNPLNPLSHHGEARLYPHVPSNGRLGDLVQSKAAIVVVYSSTQGGNALAREGKIYKECLLVAISIQYEGNTGLTMANPSLH